jgi:hypothetical protein
MLKMNWLSKMFKERSDVEPLATDLKVNQQLMADPARVPENLFVDNEQPIPEREYISDSENEANIQSFLNQDFFGKGYKDGYDYHSNDILQSYVKSIKTDFRLKLDLLIDLKRRKVLELKNQHIEVEGLSERLCQQVDALTSDLNLTIERLEKEKELSALDEGWIMKAVHNYRDGFFRGLEIFQEERFIAISTGLFN